MSDTQRSRSLQKRRSRADAATGVGDVELPTNSKRPRHAQPPASAPPLCPVHVPATDQDEPDRKQIEQLNSCCALASLDFSPYSLLNVTEVDGLFLVRGFVDAEHQRLLLREAKTAAGDLDQAMRFGSAHMPHWTQHITEALRNNNALALDDEPRIPPQLLDRDPMFDQLIVNIYPPGVGITPHVDLLRFEDGVFGISLESRCEMVFQRIAGLSPAAVKPEPSVRSDCRHTIQLNPGDLYILTGDARYQWSHCIPGSSIKCRRTSITLRKLCRSDHEN